MFGKSKKPGAGSTGAAAAGMPTDRVTSLSSQGYSEPEIIKTLREEGYSPLQVDRAMKDALRTGAGTSPAQQYGQPDMMGPPGPLPPPAAGPAGTPPYLPHGGTGSPAGEPPFAAQAKTPQPGPQAPAPGGQPQPFFPPPTGDRYAPKVWDMDDEDTDDDLDDMSMKNFPKEQRLGPKSFFSTLEEEGPPPPEREPLPFAEAPLPKDSGDRTRELKDRRRREIEELTEEITDEKWTDMAKRLRSLEERFESVSGEMQSAAAAVPGAGAPSSAEIDSMKKDLETQKHDIEETNARIDSLEEVIKGSLAPMIESVKKFSSVVRAAKDSGAPLPLHTAPRQGEGPFSSRYEEEPEMTLPEAPSFGDNERFEPPEPTSFAPKPKYDK